MDYESPVLYAGVLAGALAAGDRDFAREMALKILSFYHEDGDRAYFEAPDHYYANNWAWLGLALYAGWVEPGNRSRSIRNLINSPAGASQPPIMVRKTHPAFTPDRSGGRLR